MPRLMWTRARPGSRGATCGGGGSARRVRVRPPEVSGTANRTAGGVASGAAAMGAALSEGGASAGAAASGGGSGVAGAGAGVGAGGSAARGACSGAGAAGAAAAEGVTIWARSSRPGRESVSALDSESRVAKKMASVTLSAATLEATARYSRALRGSGESRREIRAARSGSMGGRVSSSSQGVWIRASSWASIRRASTSAMFWAREVVDELPERAPDLRARGVARRRQRELGFDDGALDSRGVLQVRPSRLYRGGPRACPRSGRGGRSRRTRSSGSRCRGEGRRRGSRGRRSVARDMPMGVVPSSAATVRPSTRLPGVAPFSPQKNA